MTIFANKALWVVDLDDQTDEDRIFGHAQAMGAEAVVIRTTSGRLATSITRFQAAGMKVYAWRWPAVVKNQGGRYANDEANYVAQTLIPAGLAGHLVDPDAGSDGGSTDRSGPNLPQSRTPAAHLVLPNHPQGGPGRGQAKLPVRHYVGRPLSGPSAELAMATIRECK